jgi:methionyl-tRNA synthetase
MEKQKITFNELSEFQGKVEIMSGQVTCSERVPKSDKLLKLTVNFGKFGDRTCLTNIGQDIEDPQTLLGLNFNFVTNLEPAKMMGITSEVMIMIQTDQNGRPTFLNNKPGNIII